MSQTICCDGGSWARRRSRKNWLAMQTRRTVSSDGRGQQRPGACRHFIAECQRHVPSPPPRTWQLSGVAGQRHGGCCVRSPADRGIRKGWLIRPTEAGKAHVLAEKPVAVAPDDVQGVRAACRRNSSSVHGRGDVCMHSRRLDRIREVLNDGESIGQIRRIVSQFSFAAPPQFAPGRCPHPQRAGAARLPG